MFNQEHSLLFCFFFTLSFLYVFDLKYKTIENQSIFIITNIYLSAIKGFTYNFPIHLKAIVHGLNESMNPKTMENLKNVHDHF
jgi:hypothetical protein